MEPAMAKSPMEIPIIFKHFPAFTIWGIPPPYPTNKHATPKSCEIGSQNFLYRTLTKFSLKLFNDRKEIYAINIESFINNLASFRCGSFYFIISGGMTQNIGAIHKIESPWSS